MPAYRQLEEAEMEKSARGSVTFKNVHYTVAVGAGCCKSTDKEILHGVSGLFHPGTLNAIMGPTGSGKSSLLDILAKRKKPKGLTGSILVDNKPQPDDFRLRSGYVVQDDIVMGTLSIRENLKFSADLRLPGYMSEEDKNNRVEEVITQLSLESCAETRIGDEFQRGVSGGERKRCNIGMELVPNPKILFFDEPTTGLDASTAKSIMRLLKRLADAGSTIILSIHQPRYAIFKLCDTIMLLGAGYTLYQGPALEGIEYFQSIGYQIEEHDNPADFFLDIINGDAVNVNHEEEDVVDKNQHCERLAIQFNQSAWSRRVEEELTKHHTYQSEIEHVNSNDDIMMSYLTNPCTQFGVLCKRTFLNLMRNPRTGIFQLFVTIIFGIITGGIYYQIPHDCEAGIQNRIGAFFFIVMNQIFANLSAIDLFILERAIFIHENVSGYYRVSAYFSAKLFCDLLPYRTIPVIVFGSITYWMMGLVARWQSFLIFVLNIIITAWSACFMAFAASASTGKQAIASLMVALAYVVQMVFSNLLIKLDSLPVWLRWLKYFSIFNYSMTALQLNEFSHVHFYEYVNTTINNTTVVVKVDCVEKYLKQQNLSIDTPWNLWQNLVALGSITLIFMTLAYIQLRRVHKLK